MKHLYLIRHAKSSWKNPGMSDKERPINKRGLKDAPKMGKYLKKNEKKPDLILTSPARRALETAELIADKIDYNIESIISDEEIYEATTIDLLEIVRNLDDSFKSVFLFGHNPAITFLSNYLTDAVIDNVPTCGVVSISFDIKSWSKIEERNGYLNYFDFPKQHKNW